MSGRNRRSNMKKSYKERILSHMPSFVLELLIDYLFRKKPYVPTLCYHKVLPELEYTKEERMKEYSVRASTFEEQMRSLLRGGYSFLWENEYDRMRKKSVIISFDDGWNDNYYIMFPIIKRLKIKVTINITANILMSDCSDQGFMTIDQIREMQESGLVSFEAHSVNHKKLAQCSLDDAEYEITECKKIIKEKIGVDSEVFACPHESCNFETMKILMEHFKMAYSYFDYPLQKHKYCIQRLYVHDDSTYKDIQMGIIGRILK